MVGEIKNLVTSYSHIVTQKTITLELYNKYQKDFVISIILFTFVKNYKTYEQTRINL